MLQTCSTGLSQFFLLSHIFWLSSFGSSLDTIPISWGGRLELPLVQAGSTSCWHQSPGDRFGMGLFSSHPPPWSRTRLEQAGPFWHLLLPPQAHEPKYWKLCVGISPFFPLLSEGKSGNFSPFPFFPLLSEAKSHVPAISPLAVSQPCRHGAHPQPRFWGGFAAFRVIPSLEQW